MKTKLLHFDAIGKNLALGLAALLIAGNAWAAKPTKTDALANAYTDVPSSAPTGSQVLRNVNADEIQVNRYTTVSSAPDESDSYPLAVTAKVHFPRGYVSTVGDAIKYLLLRTGYELGSTEEMDEHVRRVFSLRLPESNRVMGPYRVDAMLRALMGNAFTLNVDQNTRLVAYSSNATPGAAATPPMAGKVGGDSSTSSAVVSPVQAPALPVNVSAPTAQAEPVQLAQ